MKKIITILILTITSLFISSCEKVIDVPNDQYALVYTSDDGDMLQLNEDLWNFEYDILSHTYTNGYGVILFNTPIFEITDNLFDSSRFYDLESIIIPNSVTEIGSSAFSNCRSLTSITIPDSVTEISSSAFSNCTSLISITIPDRVTTIDGYAFYGCNSLTSVFCKANTPPSLGSDVFSGNALGRKIYVPTTSVEAYKSAYGWRDYIDDIVGYDFM